MKIVYVAGPFTGKTAWDIECNVRRAEETGLSVARAGAMPLIPHSNTRFFHGQCSAKFWYDGTLELLRRCDAIVMVNGWEKSKGACAEKALAEELSMEVFTERQIPELCNWVKFGVR